MSLPSDPVWGTDRGYDERGLHAGDWEYLVVSGQEDIFEGPYKFVSQGAIGAYPRFVNKAGLMVPWHSVVFARRRQQ